MAQANKWVIRIMNDSRVYYAGSLTRAEKVTCINIESASRFSTPESAQGMLEALKNKIPARSMFIDPIQVIT